MHPLRRAVFDADVPARAWVESAAANELTIINDAGKFPLRYSVHKIDSKGDITREVIETRDGTVARLVERNGQKLTAAENAAEREAPATDPCLARRLHQSTTSATTLSRTDSIQLVNQMPARHDLQFLRAGQPQQPPVPGRQIVIDFTP